MIRRSEVGDQRSEVRDTHRYDQRLELRKGEGFLIILPSILPTSCERATSSACCSDVMYPQSLAKSSEESVSPFSPSQSVSLLMKCASYLRFAHASRRFRHTDREDRRIWPVNANLSSVGNFRLSSNTRIANR